MGKRHPAFKKRSDSSSLQRPHEPLVFFLDRCLESKTVIEALAGAGLDLRLHRDFFAPDCPDVEWLPEVTNNKWVVLTKDKGIRRRPIERQALLIPNARSFILTAGDMTGEEIADTFIRHLNRIQRIAKNEKPPFIATVTKDGVKVLASPSV
jgi:predicted nuclease of predicted toxin-antitoxin system